MISALASHEEEIRLGERAVSALALPDGSTVADVAAAIRRRYVRPLRIEPVDDDRLTALTGLWVETADVAYVFYRAADPFIYQVHSVFHEFGHILLEHNDCSILDTVDPASSPAGLGGSIQRIRARGGLSDRSERLAEAVAYALSRRMLRSGAAVDDDLFG